MTTINPFQDAFNSQIQLFQKEIKAEPVEKRIYRLQILKKWIFDHQRDIQEAIYRDLRKSPTEVNLSEIKPIITEINHCLSHIRKWSKAKRVATPLFLLGSRSTIQPEPKGVVLIIAPWNFPFQLTIGPLISAIAAGCIGVIKPSEYAVHTSDLIEAMISEIYPPEIWKVENGDVEVATHLLALPFHHVFFTGSPAVGKIVMHAAAKHLTSVTLELGGSNVAVLDSSADVKDAARKLIWGKMLNLGQSCVSVNTIFVPSGMETDLLFYLKHFHQKMYPGAPAENADTMRVINIQHFNRLKDKLNAAKTAGASVETGGDYQEQDLFFPLTILKNVTLSNPILQDEIFGPLLPVVSYESLEELYNWMDQQPRPLMAYLFSTEKSAIQSFLTRTTSGGVAINETTLPFIHPHLPFGGMNTSGIGKAHGHYGFLEFSNLRPVMVQRRGITSVMPLHPPFSALKEKLSNLVIKYF